MRSLGIETLKAAMHVIFKVRGTHSIPEKIEAPPKSWEIPYDALARECLLTLSLGDAFREVAQIYSLIQD